MATHLHKTTVDKVEGNGTSIRDAIRTVSVNVGTCGRNGDTTTDVAAVTCGNCKRSKAFRALDRNLNDPELTSYTMDSDGAPVDVPADSDEFVFFDGSGRTYAGYRRDVGIHDGLYSEWVDFMISMGITDDVKRTEILERAWDHAVSASADVDFYYEPGFNRHWLDDIAVRVSNEVAGALVAANGRTYRVASVTSSTVTVTDCETGGEYTYGTWTFMGHVTSGAFRLRPVAEIHLGGSVITEADLRQRFRAAFGKTKTSRQTRRTRRGA